MAVLLRLAIFGLCVAAVFAAVVKDDEPATQTDAPVTTPVPPAPACTEGEKKADTSDCHKYTECKEGAWKDDRCFWFRKFDSVTKKCVMWGATCAKP